MVSTTLLALLLLDELLIVENNHVLGETETLTNGRHVALDVATEESSLLFLASEPDTGVVEEETLLETEDGVDLLVVLDVGHETTRATELNLDRLNASEVVDQPADFRGGGFEAALTDEDTEVVGVASVRGKATGGSHRRGLNELHAVDQSLVVAALREGEGNLGVLLGTALMLLVVAVSGELTAGGLLLLLLGLGLLLLVLGVGVLLLILLLLLLLLVLGVVILLLLLLLLVTATAQGSLLEAWRDVTVASHLLLLRLLVVLWLLLLLEVLLLVGVAVGVGAVVAVEGVGVVGVVGVATRAAGGIISTREIEAAGRGPHLAGEGTSRGLALHVVVVTTGARGIEVLAMMAGVGLLNVVGEGPLAHDGGGRLDFADVLLLLVVVGRSVDGSHCSRGMGCF
jgi:hypothetical protein